MPSSRCCVDPRNHVGNTYAKGYTVCGVCRRRYYLTDHGWQANPRCEKGRWQR